MDAKTGKLTEVFACGTAAAITPVGEFKSRLGNWLIGERGCGPTTGRLKSELVGIQRGEIGSFGSWVRRLPNQNSQIRNGQC